LTLLVLAMVTCATKSLSSVLFTPVTLNHTNAHDAVEYSVRPGS